MTTQNQWYYVKNNERCGPVEPARLKQLADAGEVQRDSLVWRVGMANWVEAEQVQGLFPPPAQPGAPSLAEPPVGAAHSVPPAQHPQPPQQPGMAPMPSTEPAATQAASDQEMLAQILKDIPTRRVKVREKSSLSYHPTAMLLDLLRPLASSSYTKASVQLFTQIGYWSVYAYVFILLLGSLIASVREQNFSLMGGIVGISIGLIALQYVAVKMLDLLGEWKFESKVPRTLFDMVAILALIAGVGGLVVLAYQGLTIKVYMLLLDAVVLFIIFVHAAQVALSLPTKEGGSEGETRRSIVDEAVEVFGGLLLVAIRTVPVAFGAGIALYSLRLLYELTKVGDDFFFESFTINVAPYSVIIIYCLLLPLVAYLASVLLRILGKLVAVVILRDSSRN